MNDRDSGTSTTTVEVRAIEHLQVDESHPERHIAILDTADGRIALFGYFNPQKKWHFMIVPREFREATRLGCVKDHLLNKHGATLYKLPGDTIDIAEAPVHLPDVVGPRPHLS